MVVQLHHYGNSNIGLFFYTDNKYTFVPPNVQEKNLPRISKLGTEIVKTTLADCDLIGVYMTGNSRGVILPYHVTDEEVRLIHELGYEYYVVEDKHNAIGNNLVVNDRRGIVNPHIPKSEIKNMEDVLGVELVSREILGYEAVGTVVLATNKGFIVHNDADEDLLNELKEIFGVPGLNVTVNMGSPFVRLGVIANDRGCILGMETSGIELQRITEALDLVD